MRKGKTLMEVYDEIDKKEKKMSCKHQWGKQVVVIGKNPPMFRCVLCGHLEPCMNMEMETIKNKHQEKVTDPKKQEFLDKINFKDGFFEVDGLLADNATKLWKLWSEKDD